MRKGLGKIPYTVIGRPQIGAGATSVAAAAAFSTSSSGGGGRGRGSPSPIQFTVGEQSKSEPADSKPSDPPPPLQGHGRGRGQPLPSSPLLPSFSSILNNDPGSAPIGRGRGHIPAGTQQKAESGSPSSSTPKRRIGKADPEVELRQVKDLPGEILNIVSGGGRGKPETPPAAHPGKAKAENRHVRQQQQQPRSPEQQLSQEEKVMKAVEILSRGDEKPGDGRTGAGTASGRGTRGGMTRGRGRGPRERIGGRGRGGDRFAKADAEDEDDPFFGDPEAEQKVAEKLGPEVMSQLTEGLEEMSCRVLPSAFDDALLEAYHTNMAIECEPEWLMEEFGTNPDIDEKPPIPLREALEKMRPFLMHYLNIENHEDWEEIMKDTMETAPLIKEIVDYYSGPDRITAKQQQAELERVAKTLPASAPASVQRFTERALLTLQSNPGWKFNKKCQFMDKLVMEVSQQYK